MNLPMASEQISFRMNVIMRRYFFAPGNIDHRPILAPIKMQDLRQKNRSLFSMALIKRHVMAGGGCHTCMWRMQGLLYRC